MPTTYLTCPHCRIALTRDDASLHCASCARVYPVVDGIADFSGGTYYDSFSSGDELPPEHLQGLALEEEGTRWRIAEYYLPLLQRDFGRTNIRVLDSGCGNALGVELLANAGVDAYGNDLSALRRWQWRERTHRERLVVADSGRLPFPDDHFDAVITSGVIEHIGVDEIGGAEYRVTPRATKEDERRRYLAELLRVTRRGGHVYVDCPNGAFPIDFWHGTAAGGARFHTHDEGFLATAREIRALAAPHRATALNPEGRLRFAQVGRHWYGRVFRWPVALLFRLMRLRAFAWLRGSALNPYLVVRIAKDPSP